MKIAHTPGPWTANSHHVEQAETRAIIATLGRAFGAHRLERVEANAHLIAEAGTVATETGLTPRQLADQRAELLAIMQKMIRAATTSDGPPGKNGYTTSGLGEIFEDMRAAIAKAHGQD